MELAQNHETQKLLRPTFYLCAGVAGAGCTTAVENIGKEIRNYDYWIDTTDLNEVVPAVTSVITLTSFGEKPPLHPRAISIAENSAVINKLIGDYQAPQL